jgi:hypothetical protein
LADTRIHPNPNLVVVVAVSPPSVQFTIAAPPVWQFHVLVSSHHAVWTGRNRLTGDRLLEYATVAVRTAPVVVVADDVE